MTRKEKIDWALYTPISWQRSLGYKVDDGGGRCRASVHEQGRGVGFYQCTRKATVTIDGYSFCGQHGRKIQQRLDEK